MNILIDTHTLYWFFTGDKNLSEPARIQILTAGKIFVPIIVLLELLYLLKKRRTLGNFSFIYKRIKSHNKFSFVSLDLAILEEVLELPSELEMHDRVIVASAQVLGAVLITKDEVMQNAYKNTIW